MLPQTLASGADRRRSSPSPTSRSAAAISPRQGQTPTRTHRPLTPSRREHATSRQQKVKKRSVVRSAIGSGRVLTAWRARPRGDERKAPSHGSFVTRAQAWWDAQRFDQPVWQVAVWREQKPAIFSSHVAKALGKSSSPTTLERYPVPTRSQRVRDEVLPDVAIYRSQLLNLFPEVEASPSLVSPSVDGGGQEAEPLFPGGARPQSGPVPSWQPTWNLASMEWRRRSPTSVRHCASAGQC